MTKSLEKQIFYIKEINLLRKFIVKKKKDSIASWSQLQV